MVTRIAMWSGPRNISTALMRSFGARPDAHVSDEPLYAHYLKSTGLPHPHADEIVATHEPDWRKVVAELVGPVPGGKPVWYQKHMAHHLLDEIDRSWMSECTNAFLIREPRDMLTSLLAKLDTVTIEDTGLPQQVALFRHEKERTGKTPIVIDSKDVLMKPAALLEKLCERVGIGYDPHMLHWKAGSHPTDGCWGPYWYGHTLKSTGFARYVEKRVLVPDAYEELARECETLYRELHEERLSVDDASLSGGQKDFR